MVCYEDMTNDIVTHCVPIVVGLNLRLRNAPHPHTRFVSWCSCRGPRQQHKIEKRRASYVVPDCDAFYSEVFLKAVNSGHDKRGELERLELGENGDLERFSMEMRS